MTNTEEQAQRMFAHCRLAWDPSCLAFYKLERPVRSASAAQVRQPIYRSAVGRAQMYGDLLAPLIEALGSDLARATSRARVP